MTEDEWCRLAYESEEVRLVTKEENATRDVSREIQIDFERGFFKNTRSIGYSYRRAEEGGFLVSVASKELGLIEGGISCLQGALTWFLCTLEM